MIPSLSLVASENLFFLLRKTLTFLSKQFHALVLKFIDESTRIAVHAAYLITDNVAILQFDNALTHLVHDV